MTTTKRPEDWTLAEIERFWAYQASHEHRLRLYFSRLVAPALRYFLQLHGVLRGPAVDLGAGPGYFVHELASQGIDCWAVDSSSASLTHAERTCAGLARFRGTALTHNFRADLPAAAFSLVTCIETIEHLPTDLIPQLIAEATRLTQPGGYLLITTPHEEQLIEGQVLCPFCDTEFHHMQHFQSFTAERLLSLVPSDAFEIVVCRGVDLSLFEPRDSLLRTLRQRYGVLRGIAKFLQAAVPICLSREIARRTELAYRLAPGPHLVLLARRK